MGLHVTHKAPRLGYHPVLRPQEALTPSPINTSALAMAEGQDFVHNTPYRTLSQSVALPFEYALGLRKRMGGLNRGVGWTDGKWQTPLAFLPY